MAQGTITPPPGFKLDNAPAQTVIQPPAGFKLDQQQSAPAGASVPSYLTANSRGEGTYKMNGPGGQVGVPFSNVPQAKELKYTVDPTDLGRYSKDFAASPQAPKSWLSPSDDWQGIKNFASQSPLGLFAHPVEAAKTVAKTLVNPYDPDGLGGKIIAPIVQNAVDQGKQAVDMAKQGSYGAAASHAILGIPVLGPTMQKAMDQSNTGGNNSYGANLKNLISSPQSMGTLAGATAGYAAPEFLKATPGVASNVLGSAGDALQDSGAARFDRFLNGGKKLPIGEYDNPGRAVLDSGPSTSIVTNRPQLTTNIATARKAAGPDIAAAVQGSSARIPLPEIKNAVASVVDPMRTTVNGSLGNPRMLGRLDEIQDSFGPTINYQGTATPTSVWNNLQTMDKNLNWNKTSPDPVEVTANNAGKQIRANTSALLKNYVPSAVQPIQQYSGLSDALDLAKDTQDIPAMKWNTLGRDAADLLIGGGTGLATHNPGLGLTVAAGTHALPMAWKLPITQTGLATGVYQAGKVLAKLGQYAGQASPAVTAGVDALPPSILRLAPGLSAQPVLASPSNPTHNNDKAPQSDDTNGNQQRQQGTPPSGISSVTPLSLIPPPVSPLSAAIPPPQSNALAIPGRRLSWGNAA